MAATAYASLVALLNTLDQIHTHPLVSTFFDMNQNKSLSEKVNFFVDFVEKYSDGDSKEVEDLVRRIADAAHEAENIIEVHAADRVLDRESPSFLGNVQLIIEKMESIKEEVIKVREEIGKTPSCLPDLPSSSSLAPPATAEATAMVGFDDYMKKLFDDLIGDDVDLSIISITGMGGIGKTTLVRNLYENPKLMRHFNIRVWVTVSQESRVRKVLLQALSSLGGDSIDMDTLDDRELSLKLYQTLFNRRYLIVLDDIWSVEIWNQIKLFFPENRNGSRIVVTTREWELVDFIGSSAVVLNFLDEEYSWKLFCEKAFPRQDFPFELQKVGEKIVSRCGGLPLAITVIGGLLGKSSKTQEYWETIAEDRSLVFNLGENNPLSLLYMSYKYLPIYLKSCFLHFGLYPEDSEIEVSTIIKLWVAEGFIKAKGGQSLEEVAESYLDELVDRNLLLCHSPSPRSTKCYTHDLVRDLCIEIDKKENFYYVQRSIDGTPSFITDQTTARSYHIKSHDSETPSILYPFIVHGKRPAPIKTRLLRVLFCDERSPYYALQEVNMRFLQDHCSYEHDYLLPSLLSRFWSLQTLILRPINNTIAPTEIWKMAQLRHIDVPELYLPDLPPPASDDDVYVLQNLQTLKEVHNLILTKEVCKRIPNIKELTIWYGSYLRSQVCPSYHLENTGCFNKLETLQYVCYISKYLSGDSLQNIKFPSSLKELTLSGCKLEWSYMAVIASLPRLQFLQLRKDAVAGIEWIFVDERFVSLKYLFIAECGVTKWIAQRSNFPVLEELSISDFPKLNEIPSGIGEISTLQKVSVDSCNESTYISAVEILHEQERFENLDLRLIIKFPYNRSDEAALFREKIEELGLTCQNLKII